MSILSSSISTSSRGLLRTTRLNSSRGRQQWFSTSRASRGGAFFNLGGLGASREAQYLSRERGIPRTEYNSNIHLIRSSEVDPFAPAPGSTRAAAAAKKAEKVAAAAAAQAQAQAQAKSEAQSMSGFFARELGRHGTISESTLGPDAVASYPNRVTGPSAREANLEAQLQAITAELRHTKQSLEKVLQRKDNAGRTATQLLLSIAITAILSAAVVLIYMDTSGQFPSGPPPKPAETLTHPAQPQPLNEQQEALDEAAAQRRRRNAPSEERALAESGLTSFETRPEGTGAPWRSLMSGLFWART
jgi:hypothetical protein